MVQASVFREQSHIGPMKADGEVTALLSSGGTAEQTLPGLAVHTGERKCPPNDTFLSSKLPQQ